MPKPLELPKGMSVLVEVDLRYVRSQLTPFLIHFRREQYKITRVIRRHKKTIHEREHMLFRVKIENHRDAYDLIQDRKTSMWSLRKAVTAR